MTKIAIIGATGLVGQQMLRVLEERNFTYSSLLLVASARSVGKKIQFRNSEYTVIGMEEAIAFKPDIAMFSAGGNTSLEWAPRFADAGSTVIDNSSAWRMSTSHKLIVPEINANELTLNDKIIANPNCSTIQMVLALAPIHKKYGIKRIVVSTYQSVTGTGKAAVDQLMAERRGEDSPKVYPHPIDMNVLPHIDVFLDNGYTKEEMKMVNETRKILGEPKMPVTATAVRLPVMGGHSESVNLELSTEFNINDIRELLSQSPGIVVQDDPENNIYPMPLYSQEKDDVFVGRIRRDESIDRGLNMWIVSDNLRKGAATNAIQIAEFLISHNLING